MFSAVKLGVATALVALLGGVFAIGVMPPQQEAAPPGAATEEATPLEAQETPPPYAAITGKMWHGTQTRAADITTGSTPPQEVWTDYAWTLHLDTNDPRLSGPFETIQNLHQSMAGDRLSGSLRAGIGRLSHEDGSWTADFHGFSKPGHSSYNQNHYVAYFTGEGGYEGLSAMLLMVPNAGNWVVDGVIIPGPMPEPPTSLEPPETE